MTHASEIGSGERFKFGENWRAFLATLSQRRIDAATTSLQWALKSEDLRGKTFLDAGCGSGLFSLAAVRLGARRVVSFDFDPDSVACATELNTDLAAASDWNVTEGSVLDEAFLAGLGTFDVVYSWGVLHHTGAMWTALDLLSKNVAGNGRLMIAIYNDQGGKSVAWRTVKRIYNRTPAFLQVPYIWAVMLPFECLSATKAILLGKSRAYVSGWLSENPVRGMNRWHDWVDWIGGYPFEVATPNAIVEFLADRNFLLKRIETCGAALGCNQYLFVRKAQ